MKDFYDVTYPIRWNGATEPKPKQRRVPLFACLECGKKFYNVKSAENAAFGDGCPKCGATDIEDC